MGISSTHELWPLDAVADDLSLSLQVLVGIPDRLSVDEVEDWAAEEEPEEVYWRLVLHARKHSRRSSE